MKIKNRVLLLISMTLLCGRGMVLKVRHFMVKAYCFIDDDVFSKKKVLR